MITRISHVGVAVRNIEEAVSVYTNLLGLKPPPAGIVELPEIGVRSALFPIGDNYIELIEATDPQSEVAKLLEERGEGLLHIAVEVDDIDAEVKSLRARGAEVQEIPPLGPIITYKSAIVTRECAKGVPLELVPKGTAHKCQRMLLGLQEKDEPLPL